MNLDSKSTVLERAQAVGLPNSQAAHWRSEAELMREGYNFENSGDLPNAESLYRRVVNLNPLMADAWFRLGLCTMKRRSFSEAVAFLRRAVEIQPTFAEAWSNLAIALATVRQPSQAEAAFHRALELWPQKAEIHRNFGSFLRLQGRIREAIDRLQKSLELEPASIIGLLNLAIAHKSDKNYEDAIACLQRALVLQPNNAQVELLLADYLKASQDTLAAMPTTQRQVIEASKVAAQIEEGSRLLTLGKTEEAMRILSNAVASSPESAEGHYRLGNCQLSLGYDEQALVSFGHAVRLQPENASYHCDFGIALARMQRFDEAIAAYHSALARDPNHCSSHHNLGVAHFYKRELDKAAECYRAALRIAPNFPEAHCNLASVRLLQGRWQEGFEEFEYRWKCQGVTSHSFDQPVWDGSPLEGRTILLHFEQGIGDVIQFIRYAPIVKEFGGRVIVVAKDALIPLLSTCPGIDLVVSPTGHAPSFHVHAALMSLPRILMTSLTSLPCNVPYLSAEPERLARWSSEFAAIRDFKIGIAWQGSKSNRSRVQRSIALEEFEPLAQVPGVQLFSLQKDDASAEICALSDRMRIVDLATRLDNNCGAFLDTAAVMKCLDLVISIDSAPAHLAGALGVPVWVPLSFAADWRWLLDRTDTPWYPTMRLFRQRKPGDWSDVFAGMAGELQSLVSQARSVTM